MRLHSIKARNFMSLRDCCIDNLDAHMNFLVGPNACGKTTVFRALKAIRDIFNPGKNVPFNQLCTRGVTPREIDLTIDVEFNTPWEQELILAFLCTSLSQTDQLRTYFSQSTPRIEVKPEGFTAFSRWLLKTLRSEVTPFLFRGNIRVSHRSRVYDNLSLSYTFQCGDAPVTIATRPIDSVLLGGNTTENASGGYSAVNTFLDCLHQIGVLGDITSLLTEQSVSAINFDPVACIRYLADKRVMLSLSGANAQEIDLPAFRRFAELSGNLNLANLSNRNFTFGYVLQILLQHAFVFTNNLRVPVSDIAAFNWEEVTKPDIDLDNERQIPLLLYRLKNGDFAERAHFERIQKSFKMLVGDDSGFDIHTGFGNNQQSALSIDIQITDSEGDIPLTYHGAGIWEALMLSTILDESEGRIILLDEPASNLHPSMQHKLVEALHTVPGQVIVVTHSAHMLPTAAEDFRKVRRMQKTNTGTLVKGMDSSSWLRLDKLEKELNKSSDLGGLLFANGVILVEGETETGALSEWFPKSAIGQGRTFADLNLALCWVGGKTNFPFYMHFLSELGVPWVAICDGDALPPNENRPLWNALKGLKRIDDTDDTSSTTASFEELKALAEKAGVYTANTSSTGKFEDILEVKSYKDSNNVPGQGKPQEGRYIAACIPCPNKVEEILQKALCRLGR